MAKKKSSSSKTVDATDKNLVIVESPTKAKTINKYLGKDYVVMASVGHVRDLPSRNPKGVKNPVPGVDLNNSFAPNYEVLPDKKKTISELKKAAKQAKEIWFATDLDREGEAIAWHLADTLGIKPENARRVVFNAITKSAIQDAFSNPNELNMGRVDAQQARRILDRIVGYQVSPLLWKKVAGGLSAGRVQSVAVRLIVEREREIDAFVPDEYWQVHANFTPDIAKAPQLTESWAAWLKEKKADAAEALAAGDAKKAKSIGATIKRRLKWLADHGCFPAELSEINGKTAKIVTADEARNFCKDMGITITNEDILTDAKAKGPAQNKVTLHTQLNNEMVDYKIRSIDTKRSKSKPSAPFITSTLQQTAANTIGFSTTQTMRVAQSLYEGVNVTGQGAVGLITYMRTDSTHLSGTAINQARDYIQSAFGPDYLPEKPNFYSSSNKAAQEAHEAIRPTDPNLSPDLPEMKKSLNDQQYKLYKLIWQRFVACQMKPAEWDATTLLIDAKPKAALAGTSATFRAHGRVLVFDGHYKAIGRPTTEEPTLPRLTEGQPVTPIDIDPLQKFTSPPPRYTEASLVKKLESEGIGRPSTYASIIQVIQNRKYVEKITNRFHATDIGTVVTDKLLQGFPRIMDVGYTRQMEDQLDKIEEENLNWVEMLNGFYDPFKKNLETALDDMTHAKAEAEPAPYKCQKCGAPTCYRFGRNGRFLSCTRYNIPPVEVTPEGQSDTYLLYKARGKARPQLHHIETNDKFGWTKLTKADKVKFQEISDNMPEGCDYAAPIDREGKPLVAEVTDILCPVDGTRMIKKSGRFGPYLAAENYPEVKFTLKLDPKKGTVVLPKTPPLLSGITCSKCNAAELYVRDSKRGLWLSCSSFPKCRGREALNKQTEEDQKRINEAWEKHVEENPVPDIFTVDGVKVAEGYKPIVAGADEATDSVEDSMEEMVA